jgi:hypothetical protein
MTPSSIVRGRRVLNLAASRYLDQDVLRACAPSPTTMTINSSNSKAVSPEGSNSSASERRRRRSSDPITALHYQLAEVRRSASLDALVLADETGCLVAGAGAWPVCEELAAYAPLLGKAGLRSVVSARVALVSAQAEQLAFELDGQPVWLCGRGGTAPRSPALERARAGVTRILRAG